MTSPVTRHLTDLPNEMLQRISLYLDKSLFSFGMTCSRFSEAAFNPRVEVWKAILREEGIVQLHNESPKAAVKRYFKEVTQVFYPLTTPKLCQPAEIELRRRILIDLKFRTQYEAIWNLFKKNSKARDLAAGLAIQQRNWSLFSNLFRLGPLQKYLNFSLYYAVYHKNFYITTQLLENSSLTVNDRLYALEVALRKKNFVMASMIYPAFDPYMAMQIAAVEGQFDVLWNLLRKEEKSPATDEGHYLIKLVMIRNIKEIDHLLEDHLIHSTHHFLALLWAVGQGDLACVQALLTARDDLSTECLYSLIAEAGRKNYVDVFRYLIRHQPLNPAFLFDLLLKMVSAGNIAIIQEILAFQLFPEAQLFECTKTATENGYLNILTFFLRSPELDEDQRGQLLEIAAAGGHLLCVQTIFNLGPLKLEALKSSLNAARAGQFEKIVQFLDR